MRGSTSTLRDQEMASDALELELRLGHWEWVLKTGLRSSIRRVCTLYLLRCFSSIKIKSRRKRERRRRMCM